jgi:hypothetical protein
MRIAIVGAGIAVRRMVVDLARFAAVTGVPEALRAAA